jgi:hypothetical protein
MVEDIKFIKTDKEGDVLQAIKENYPNSIIDVNSQSEKNIYIGSERVTDNYNLGVDESSITNNVGGMSSGINASELKGKSISEILDIILFASNNNMTLKGVQVVNKIENLTDSTLEDVYQGMVVSVVEDNSLYILLTDGSDDREWKKVGSDIDVEEIKESAKELKEPITVAGLSGSLGANISNGKTYTNIEDILRDLLCKEIYPSVSLSTTNPTITFGGLKGVTANNYESVMEVGSVLNLNVVTLESASITSCSRMGVGFSYGYSVGNDSIKDADGNPPVIYGTSSLEGSYSLEETYSPSSIGTVRSINPSENCEDVKFSEGSVNIELGSNIITITAQSPIGTYLHPEYPEYYIISNLGNTSDDKKLSKTPEVSGTLSSIESSASIEVTGVYPVYVNIDSGCFVDEPIKMPLTAGDVFEFNVPSEVESNKHFSFYYPSGRNVISFEIKDLSGNYVPYSAAYENVLVYTPSQSVNGEEILYMRLNTIGKLQGEGTYKITLSKGLDIK